jgi:O-antigen ligase
MGNPNVLGQLMTWCLVAFTMALLFNVGNRILNASVAFACLITLALTGSRFGLFTAAFGLVLVFAVSWSAQGRRSVLITTMFLILPAFVVTTWTIAKLNQSTLARFETLKHPFEIDSFRSRIDDQWRDAAADFVQSPFVGHGPVKIAFTGIVTDSEYLDVLKEFGVIGFLAYVAYFLFPLTVMWKGLKRGQRAGRLLETELPTTFLILRISILMLLTALVMNVALTTFFNHLLQAFLWLWAGLGLRASNMITKSGVCRLDSETSRLRADAGIPRN